VKKFLSTQDIEDLAAQGRTELVIDDDTVLTDLARHAAQQLGIALVSRSHSAPATSPALPSAPMPRGEAVVGLGKKPKGCQHAPVVRASSASQPPEPATNPGSSDTVVDQLVGLVKRLGPRTSGN
jgi:hypothetical protein